MKLKDYLKIANRHEVLNILIAMYDRYPYNNWDLDKERIRYIMLMDKLLGMKQTHSKYSLDVHKCVDGNESWDGEVTGTKKNNKERYAMEFTPWKQILAMPIVTEYSVEKTVAYILWEMTFMGFDEAQIKNKLDDLKQRVKNIKKNGAGKAIDLEEARKLFK